MPARRTKRTLHQLLRPLAAPGARRARAGAPQDSPEVLCLWNAIAMIPPGRVSTYGEVARAAGLPGRARQAGYALRISPSHLKLPWHRVVGAGGKIAFPRNSRQFREQVRLLRSEGIAVNAGRVARSALDIHSTVAEHLLQPPRTILVDAGAAALSYRGKRPSK